MKYIRAFHDLLTLETCLNFCYLAQLTESIKFEKSIKVDPPNFNNI